MVRDTLQMCNGVYFMFQTLQKNMVGYIYSLDLYRHDKDKDKFMLHTFCIYVTDNFNPYDKCMVHTLHRYVTG